ncbi:MAG: DDE-type integrase/transposase/recombinase [Hadesarchaea archaeon]|nr:DDE-type integrase/transposase/recombinase [Hadesarchaea archaeon]
MQPELKEFLSTLLPHAFGGVAEKVFERNKKPLEVKVFACYLYLHGPSFDQTSALLGDLGLKVAKSAVWYWFQQVGAEIGELLVPQRQRRYLVVDETEVRTRDGLIWIFAAIDPENREIVGLHVSKHRELVDVLQFLKRCLRRCEGKPTLISDGGPWYRWPAQRLGLEHVVLSGGDRNYIERLFETFKDRIRTFDCFFPTERIESVQNFCYAFGFFYNRCRRHQSMKGPPSGGGGGLKAWVEVFI